MNILAQAIANTITAVGIVAIAFALTGQWPPSWLLIGSSLGGALSPFAWRIYRRFRPQVQPNIEITDN